MQDDIRMTDSAMQETRLTITSAYKIVINQAMKTRFVKTDTPSTNALGCTIQRTKPLLQSEVGKIGYTNQNGKRYICKIGRYLTQHLRLKEYLTDLEIETMVNHISASMKGFIYEVCTGDRILENYRKAFGNSSCMTHAECQPRLEFYSINPEKIAQLICQCGGQQARALLWTLDNGQQYLDRIYCNADRAYKAMTEWANERKIPHYHNMSCIEQSVRDTFIVSGLQLHKKGRFPYMDSFTKSYFKATDGRILALVHYACKANLMKIASLKGYLVGGDTYHCEHRGCDFTSYSNDDFNYSDRFGLICQACWDTHYTVCEMCEGDDLINNFVQAIVEGQPVDLCSVCRDETYAICQCKEHVDHENCFETRTIYLNKNDSLPYSPYNTMTSTADYEVLQDKKKTRDEYFDSESLYYVADLHGHGGHVCERCYSRIRKAREERKAKP